MCYKLEFDRALIATKQYSTPIIYLQKINTMEVFLFFFNSFWTYLVLEVKKEMCLKYISEKIISKPLSSIFFQIWLMFQIYAIFFFFFYLTRK